MQMLKAGGLKVPGSHPYHELVGKELEDNLPTWPDEFDAVKWLNPGKNQATPPPGRIYRCLWLVRDEHEQAKSWIKYSTTKRGKPPANEPATFLKTLQRLRADTLKGHDKLKAVSSSPAPVLRFSAILEHPMETAKALASWSGRDLNIEAMAAVVIARSPDCHPTMLEGELAPS